MKLVLSQNVFTIAGLLTADECRVLIARGEEVGFQRAAVRTAAGPQMRPGIRDNDRAEFVDRELASVLWLRCLPFVPAELEGGIAVGLDDNFRFYRFDVGQRFKRHKDGVVARSPTERSRLSCLFYLNDGFVGGETVFHSTSTTDGVRTEDVVVVPQAGDTLFFLHERWHEGRALVAGRKYVLRSDVFYRFPATSPAE